jgi:predicted class III extradiol MEMO1 family dioxygenase
LQCERFEKHQDAVVEEFRSLPTRAAAHVGGVYQADPVELVRQLDGFFTAAQGPGLPDPRMLASTPQAIVAPHIDFHRGGPA